MLRDVFYCVPNNVLQLSDPQSIQQINPQNTVHSENMLHKDKSSDIDIFDSNRNHKIQLSRPTRDKHTATTLNNIMGGGASDTPSKVDTSEGTCPE